ncbi:hypothetical protein AAFF_G00134720 [Aldrovandia affinis]|uniref:Sodium channel regulatory subunit beta-3 n=1 Tax=Aldrovandia affinis TaxID=143900 RepID=A0AAD7W9D4_9TELE|nr:hypothetical protein AAFF_G00134720 [Aldrovandia affinis]
MTPPVTLVLQSLPLFIFIAPVTWQVCVELEPNTEAVEDDKHIKLICISCKRRSEIPMRTQLDWYYINDHGGIEHIFQFIDKPQVLERRWEGRLQWKGSRDLQDLSISIINVKLNDTGTYRCMVTRQMAKMPPFVIIKTINLVVRVKALSDTTAWYSKIMTYSLLAHLTFWILVALVYCFRKIARAEARARDNV